MPDSDAPCVERIFFPERSFSTQIFEAPVVKGVIYYTNPGDVLGAVYSCKHLVFFNATYGGACKLAGVYPLERSATGVWY